MCSVNSLGSKLNVNADSFSSNLLLLFLLRLICFSLTVKCSQLIYFYTKGENWPYESGPLAHIAICWRTVLDSSQVRSCRKRRVNFLAGASYVAHGGKAWKDQVILSGVERNAEMQDEISLKEAEHKVFLLLQGFVQGSTEKAQCKVGLQPTGMDSRVEPKQMGDSIKVNARSSWASVIKLWALLIAVF